MPKMFNWASTLDTALSFQAKANNNNVDKLGIYFTGDGHLITHDIDFFRVPGQSSSDKTNSTANKALADAIDFQMQNSSTNALRYKGTVGTGATVTELPTKDVYVGDVYVVANDGGLTVNSKTLEAGDMVIALEVTDTKVTWTVIQKDLMATSNTVNGESTPLYGSGSAFHIYAPTTAGTANTQAVVSSGNGAPKWVGIAPSITNTNGKLYISVLGLNSTESTLVAHHTIAALSAGTGLSFTGNGTFNGSTAKTLNLNVANATTIGGVLAHKVLTTAPTVTLSTAAGRYYGVEADSTGKLYVNVPWLDTHTQTLINTNSKETTIAAAGTFINLVDSDGTNKTVAGSILITGDSTSNVSVTGTAGNITISVGLVSKDNNGIVPKASVPTTSLTDANSVLTYNGTSVSWQKLPEKAFKWRPISVGSTDLASDEALKFGNTDSIYATYDSTNNLVGFDLMWYNIDSKSVELL